MENKLNKNFESILTLKDNLQEGGLRTKNILKKTNSDNPLISIITVVLNGDKYLEECIKSLQNQKIDNYEHIIIDGGSTDNTINIIKKFKNKIDYWCQINDNGIYDAFNYGMQLARGTYLGFLNSDDTFKATELGNKKQEHKDVLEIKKESLYLNSSQKDLFEVIKLKKPIEKQNSKELEKLVYWYQIPKNNLGNLKSKQQKWREIKAQNRSPPLYVEWTDKEKSQTSLTK